MRTQETAADSSAQNALISQVEQLTEKQELPQALQTAARGSAEFPDSPVPQNLIGIVEEMEGRQQMALNHFRASLDLGPGYAPARENLNAYSRAMGPLQDPAHPVFTVPEQPEHGPVCHIVQRDGLNYVESGPADENHRPDIQKERTNRT